MIRSLCRVVHDLADAVLLEVETGLVRLGERLLAYAAECDPTPDFEPISKEEERADALDALAPDSYTSEDF